MYDSIAFLADEAALFVSSASVSFASTAREAWTEVRGQVRDYASGMACGWAWELKADDLTAKKLLNCDFHLECLNLL